MNKKTNKTAHVLKLLTNHDETLIENPMLNEEFKDEMIHSRSPIVQKEQNKPSSHTTKSPDTTKLQEVNIISELVQENLTAVLERFRCCTCDICKTEITITALNEIPPKYARVNNGSFELVEKLKKQHVSEVVNSLVKIVIQSKRTPYHK